MCLILVLSVGKELVLAGHQVHFQVKEHKTSILMSCYTSEEADHAPQHQKHSPAELKSGLEAEI